MAKAETYTIPHIGLKKAIHEWSYQLDGQFFKKFDNASMEGAEVDVHVVFDKTNSPFIIDFFIEGHYKAECDKCAAEIKLPLQGQYRVFVKLDIGAEEAEAEDDELEVLFISPDQAEIDIEAYLYDYSCLSVPYSKVCEDPGNTDYCDKEVVKLLQKLSKEDKPTTDPRWDGLNKLKDLN